MPMPRTPTRFVVETERAWQGLGSIQYGVSEKERKSLAFRRTLYVVEDVKAGEPGVVYYRGDGSVAAVQELEIADRPIGKLQ